MFMTENTDTHKNTVTLTDGNFYDTIKKNRLVLVDFWAEWCAPCRSIAPTVEEIANEFKEKVLVGKLNVDANKKIPKELAIMAIPTLILFKEGKPVDSIVGAASKSNIVALIKKYMNSE